MWAEKKIMFLYVHMNKCWFASVFMWLGNSGLKSCIVKKSGSDMFQILWTPAPKELTVFSKAYVRKL